MRRLFIAVDLSINVVERLVRLQEEIDQRLADRDVKLRHVAAPNIHVTLKFLGDVEEDAIDLLSDKLTRLVKPLFPFEVHCRGMGIFPTPRRPRILWAGLDEKGSEVMGLLQQAIEQDFELLGFEREPREFKPHVTLARVKSGGAVDLTELVTSFGDYDFGSTYIRDIVLFESELHADGARYHVVDRFNLGEH